MGGPGQQPPWIAFQSAIAFRTACSSCNDIVLSLKTDKPPCLAALSEAFSRINLSPMVTDALPAGSAAPISAAQWNIQQASPPITRSHSAGSAGPDQIAVPAWVRLLYRI